MNEKGTILLVDDEEEILALFKEILEDEGYKVETANNAKEALKLLEEKDFDLILSDMRMPSLTGEQFLEKVREKNDYTSFVIMTAYGTIENAVSCMKKGAFHYLTKPIDFNDPKVWKIIEEAVEKAKLKKENIKLKKQLEEAKSDVDFIITVSPSMKRVLKDVKHIAQYDLPVLITGESGTGKELIAKAIHQLSQRKNKPLIAINCANISPDIMEAEFFGYKKGAFTGAETDKAGIFEEADGGTVFLDEIGEMPLPIQSKLLRFLESKTIRRIGDTKEKKVDVRIISATNRNLEELVRQGLFRQDLYFRISTLRIELPPLRERREDIPALVYHFIEQFNKNFGKKIKGISQEALEFLINYDWEGNVRQLKNVIESACIYAEDYIELEHIPKFITGVKREDFFFDYMKAKKTNEQKFMEKYLSTILSMTKGNITQAAKLANIERQSLQKLLKKYGVNPEEFRKK